MPISAAEINSVTSDSEVQNALNDLVSSQKILSKFHEVLGEASDAKAEQEYQRFAQTMQKLLHVEMKDAVHSAMARHNITFNSGEDKLPAEIVVPLMAQSMQLIQSHTQADNNDLARFQHVLAEGSIKQMASAPALTKEMQTVVNDPALQKRIKAEETILIGMFAFGSSNVEIAQRIKPDLKEAIQESMKEHGVSDNANESVTKAVISQMFSESFEPMLALRKALQSQEASRGNGQQRLSTPEEMKAWMDSIRIYDKEHKDKVVVPQDVRGKTPGTVPPR